MIYYLIASLVFLFFAFFLIIYYLLAYKAPSSDFGVQPTLIETIKNTFDIQKHIMKVKFIHDRLNGIWVKLGKPSSPLPEDMVIMKILCMVGAFAMCWLFHLKAGAMLLALGAFFLPDMYFSNKANARLRQLERNFPAALDLLTLCVEAGIDFMAALSKIIENSEQNPLMDEFQEIIRELQLGASRKQALRNFANRCDLEVVNSFVSVVIQSEELGSSLVSVLRDYSFEMKMKRFQTAEKLAMEAPVKMLIPMMIFIFPGVFILIFGPIALKIMETI